MVPEVMNSVVFASYNGFSSKETARATTENDCDTRSKQPPTRQHSKDASWRWMPEPSRHLLPPNKFSQWLCANPVAVRDGNLPREIVHDFFAEALTSLKPQISLKPTKWLPLEWRPSTLCVNCAG